MKLSKKYILKLNKYGHVQNIPCGWVEMPTNYTRKFENMGVPIYTAVVGFKESGWFSTAIKVKITHRDFLDVVHEICDKARSTESEYVDKALRSHKRIAAALYSINKEADKYRDQQRLAADAIYDNEMDNRYSDLPEHVKHRKHHAAKIKKEALYGLKDRALRKILDEWSVRSSGYHVMADGNKIECIEIEGYSFHTVSNTSDVNLGDITGKTAIDGHRGMSPYKAKKVIEAFLSQRITLPEVEEAKSETDLVETR